MVPLRLIEFFSANSIKSENFIALSAFSPFATMFWEWLLEPLTGLGIKEISNQSLVAGLIITFGCLLTAVYQIYKTRKYGVEAWREYIKEHDKDDIAVYHTQDLVKKALNYFENNHKETALALNISECTVKRVLDKTKHYAFKDSVTADIMANYKENIANSDHLTKLKNLSGLTSVAEEYMKSSTLVSLMFLDLNNFKPVNDKYGHEYGDFVLKTIAKRLASLESDYIEAFRLGGDEFVLLFRNYEKAHLESFIGKFQEIIEEDIVLENKITVNVSASIGLAEYNTDAKTLDELLEVADKSMYKDKEKK